MYNVLIADDEPKVCSLIEYVVDCPDLGLEIQIKKVFQCAMAVYLGIVIKKRQHSNMHKQ